MATPTNSNYLSPINFRLVIEKLPDCSFFAQSVILPSMEADFIEQFNPVHDIPLPGDKLTFGNLTLDLLCDEDMKNYKELYRWVKGLYHIDSLDDYASLHQSESLRLFGRYNPRVHGSMFSDASLEILTNNSTPNNVVRFVDMFPISMSALPFTTSATDVHYLTARIVFKFSSFSFY
jgi:hypothetical protein